MPESLTLEQPQVSQDKPLLRRGVTNLTNYNSIKQLIFVLLNYPEVKEIV